MNVLDKKPYFKIPIKFISVFPRIKVNNTSIDFGEVRERMDAVRSITVFNEGERDIPLTVEPTSNLAIEGNTKIQAHRSQTLKVILRAVKSGKIAETISFKIFEGLSIDIKIFATCRSSSIRSKKLGTLNSTRGEQS